MYMWIMYVMLFLCFIIFNHYMLFTLVYTVYILTSLSLLYIYCPNPFSVCSRLKAYLPVFLFNCTLSTLIKFLSVSGDFDTQWFFRDDGNDLPATRSDIRRLGRLYMSQYMCVTMVTPGPTTLHQEQQNV